MLRVHLCVVGRLRAGPERDLIDDYTRRFNAAGKALGLGPLVEHEVEDKRGGGMGAEAALLARAVPEGAVLVCLDERGAEWTSPDLAARMADWRDQGRGDLAFVIGGADGIDPGLRGRADVTLRLGRMVWPHMLARVMLAEQIYRAATILAGSPYHRA